MTSQTLTPDFAAPAGTVASNLVVNNNFGTSGGANPASSIFARQTGPYTLAVTAGTSAIKGIGFGYDVTYDIAAVPVATPGDYDHNGVVDAADYVLWRKGDLAADSNGDTVVDQADYDFWRTNFGNGGAGAGTGISAAAVPEPLGTVLLTVGLLTVCACRRNQRA